MSSGGHPSDLFLVRRSALFPIRQRRTKRIPDDALGWTKQKERGHTILHIAKAVGVDKNSFPQQTQVLGISREIILGWLLKPHNYERTKTETKDSNWNGMLLIRPGNVGVLCKQSHAVSQEAGVLVFSMVCCDALSFGCDREQMAQIDSTPRDKEAPLIQVCTDISQTPNNQERASATIKIASPCSRSWPLQPSGVMILHLQPQTPNLQAENVNKTRQRQALLQAGIWISPGGRHHAQNILSPILGSSSTL